MATTEKEVVTVLTLKTGDSYNTINDLKDIVKQYNAEVNAATIGGDEYKEACAKLAEAKVALKNATQMATKATAEDWQAVDISTKSYNELTQQMSALKAEWRSTTDAVRKADLAGQIDAINTELKKQDASIGNYQRNVGDYANQMAQGMEIFKKSVGNAVPGLDALGNSAKAFAANPMIAVVGLLVRVFADIIAKMKSTEEGTKSLNRIMEAFGRILEPVEKLVGLVAEGISELVGVIFGLTDAQSQQIEMQKKQNEAFENSKQPIDNAIKKLRELLGVYDEYEEKEMLRIINGSNSAKFWKGNIDETISMMQEGVLNADVATERIKNDLTIASQYLTEEETAALASYVEMQGKKIAEKKKDVETTKQVVKEEKDAFLESLREMSAEEKEIADADAANMASQMELYDANVAADKAAKDAMNAASKAYFAREDQMRKENDAKEEKELKKKEEREKKKKAIMNASLAVSAGVFGALADLLESNSDEAEKNAQGIKNLRAGEAVVNTISGAIAAFMGCQSLGQPWGAILGAIQAAAVTATGMAQVASIYNTDVSTDSKPSASASSSAAYASVSAPTPQAAMPAVQSITSASDEMRLNDILGDQRVYIVSDDIQEDNRRVQVRESETSFS